MRGSRSVELADLASREAGSKAGSAVEDPYEVVMAPSSKVKMGQRRRSNERVGKDEFCSFELMIEKTTVNCSDVKSTSYLALLLVLCTSYSVLRTSVDSTGRAHNLEI